MSDPLAAALTLLAAALTILAIVLSGTLVAAELWTVGRRRTAPGARATTFPAAGTSTRSPSFGASSAAPVTRAH